MKESNYNLIIRTKNRNKVIYNTLYGSVTLVPKSFSFTNLKKLKPEVKNLLMLNKHLIPDEINELDLIRSQNRLQRFNKETLELTILPTLWCNLNCQYCYENKRKEEMTTRDIAAICNFVEAKSSNVNTISILWFGGEPLLRVDIIETISKKVSALAKRKKINFKNSIITNGTLLNEKTRDRLAKIGIKYVQITLDGPPEIHDKRKPFINGGATFKLILDNILKAIDYFDVSIRINVDDENIHSVRDLVDILSSLNLQNKLYIYVAKTENVLGVCESIGGACLNDIDFLNKEKRILQYLQEKGFKKIARPSYRPDYCTADNVHSYTIIPNNKIYKCWHLVSDPKEQVGTLSGSKIVFNHNIYKWLAYDPIDDIGCRRCRYLPLCMGGCPKIRLEEKRKRCDNLKNSITKFIEFLMANTR